MKNSKELASSTVQTARPAQQQLEWLRKDGVKTQLSESDRKTIESSPGAEFNSRGWENLTRQEDMMVKKLVRDRPWQLNTERDELVLAKKGNSEVAIGVISSSELGINGKDSFLAIICRGSMDRIYILDLGTMKKLLVAED